MSQREVLWFGKSEIGGACCPWLWGRTEDQCQTKIRHAGIRFVVPAEYEIREITKPRKQNKKGSR